MTFVPIMLSKEQPFNEKRAYRKASWETDPVVFRNQQWAVTKYGIENVAGPYHYYISRADLRKTMGSHGHTWVDHMAEKNWVDLVAFENVFRKALEIYPVGS